MVLRVRDITNEEGNKLRRIVRHGREPIEMKRAQVVLASAQGFTPPKIALIAGMSEEYVRDLIHAFNAHGFAMLKPKWGPGRPPKFTEEQRKGLVDLATSRPRDLDLPYQEWSLSRLREEAVKRGIVESISEEWLRVILHEADVSRQSIRTWKTSKDPDFAAKKRYIERLTRKRRNPPVVLSADEVGPIQVIPHGGDGWFAQGRPGRIPATYPKDRGTAYYFLCLNVFKQRLSGDLYFQRDAANWLDFMRHVRWRYPGTQRIYWIQDGLSTHWTPEVEAYAKSHHVVLVPTATQASWMNPVECQAGDIQDLALAGADPQDPLEVSWAMDSAVAYRNEERRARGKTFRDTVRKDKRRRSKKPVWKRATRGGRRSWPRH